MLTKILFVCIYFLATYLQLQINMQALTLNVEGLFSKNERDIEIAVSDFFQKVEIPSDNQVYLFSFQELFEATFFGVSGQVLKSLKNKAFRNGNRITKGLEVFKDNFKQMFNDVYKRIIDCYYINEDYLGTTTSLMCISSKSRQFLDLGVSQFIHHQIYTEHGKPTNHILLGVKSGYSICLQMENFSVIYFNFHLDSKNMNNRRMEIDDIVGKTIEKYKEVLMATHKKIFVIITGDLNARTGSNQSEGNLSDQFNDYLFSTMSDNHVDYQQEVVQRVMNEDEWKEYLKINNEENISYLDRFLESEENLFEPIKEQKINFRPTYSYYNYKQIKDLRRDCHISDKESMQIRKESDKIFRNTIKDNNMPNEQEVIIYNRARTELLNKVKGLKEVEQMCLKKYPDVLLKTQRATSYTDRIFWTQNILKEDSKFCNQRLEYKPSWGIFKLCYY